MQTLYFCFVISINHDNLLVAVILDANIF